MPGSPPPTVENRLRKSLERHWGWGEMLAKPVFQKLAFLNTRTVLYNKYVPGTLLQAFACILICPTISQKYYQNTL